MLKSKKKNVARNNNGVIEGLRFTVNIKKCNLRISLKNGYLLECSQNTILSDNFEVKLK